MRKFHWFCPVCKKAFYIDDKSQDYLRAWQGKHAEYVHSTPSGFEHKLECVNAVEFFPERGLIGVYVGRTLHVVPFVRLH